MHGHSGEEVHQMLRQLVRAFTTCPRCNAPDGAHCIGSRGQTRYAMHQERWDRYAEQNPKGQSVYLVVYKMKRSGKWLSWPHTFATQKEADAQAAILIEAGSSHAFVRYVDLP